MKHIILRIAMNPRHSWGHYVEQRYLGFLWLRLSNNYDSIEKCQEFIDTYADVLRERNLYKEKVKATRKPQKISISKEDKRDTELDISM